MQRERLRCIEMVRIARLYLDTCALVRLFDQRNQVRVRAEAHAIEDFFSFVFQGSVRWVISEVLEAEIAGNPDEGMRSEALQLLAATKERVVLSEDAFQRAGDLENLGYGAFDALHLACAEQAQVDGLLTADDRFIRLVRRGLGNPGIRVENPLDWRRGFTP